MRRISLSTLHDYIDALGGRLELRAVFPDGAVIDLMPGELPVPQSALATAD